MKTRNWLHAIIFTVVLVTPVMAQEDTLAVSTGNGLLRGLEACDSPQNRHDKQHCDMATGYVEGATDVLLSLGVTTSPAHTTLSQIHDIVRNYCEITRSRGRRTALYSWAWRCGKHGGNRDRPEVVRQGKRVVHAGMRKASTPLGLDVEVLNAGGLLHHDERAQPAPAKRLRCLTRS